MATISRISPLDELRKAAGLTGPQMPVGPDEASANAQGLQQSPMQSNAGAIPFLSPGAGGPATTIPGADPRSPGGARGPDSLSFPVRGAGPNDAALNGLLAARMGAGADVVAGRQKADEQRMQAETDQQIADRGLEDGSDQARAVAQAGIKNTVGGILSEGTAANSFGPMATQAGDLANARKLAEIGAQYGGPATTKAANDLAVAHVNAQGRVGSAAERKGSQQDEGRKVLGEYYKQWGSKADQGTIDAIKKEFGLDQPDTPSPAVSGLLGAGMIRPQM